MLYAKQKDQTYEIDQTDLWDFIAIMTVFLKCQTPV